ncbi:hypothetical protein [Priestia megaterium]|uniref:hypothetical protein n=1 Tax=Priestia megaterium TaxID=1404 RepID=UPI00366B817F
MFAFIILLFTTHLIHEMGGFIVLHGGFNSENNEVLSINQLIGGVIIILGVVLSMREASKKQVLESK